MSDDPYDLRRFVQAQNGVYESVCGELARGRKSSHWMWYIFPQLRGLGHSATAKAFGISGRAEARAYLDHHLLGARLKQCTELVNQVRGRTLGEIFGAPDDLKFRSSMTLFAQVAPDRTLFQDALDRYCGGNADARTLELLDQLP